MLLSPLLQHLPSVVGGSLRQQPQPLLKCQQRFLPQNCSQQQQQQHHLLHLLGRRAQSVAAVKLQLQQLLLRLLLLPGLLL
jgi:hypothetical protein